MGLLPTEGVATQQPPRVAFDVRVGAGRLVLGHPTLRAVAGSRLLVWVAGLAGLALGGRGTRTAALYDPAHLTAPFSGSLANWLLAPAARWDSAWYLQIAHAGYAVKQSTALFPLYPLLLRAGGELLGSALVAGVLISLGCMIAGLELLYRLARLDLSEAQARATVALLAFFPTALFFSALYTEALFLLLSVGTIYAARRERWAWAGLLGALAAATRSNGVLLLVPLALIYLYGPRPQPPFQVGGQWWRPRYRVRADAAWLGLVPIGLIAYLGYLAVTGHSPLAPFQAEALWQRQFAGPFGAVIHAIGALPGDFKQLIAGTPGRTGAPGPLSWSAHDLLDLGFLGFAIAGLCFAWRRLPVAYIVYAILLLAEALSYPTPVEPLKSFSRYLLVIFPIFMGWGARIGERRSLSRTTIGVCGVLLALFSALWASWAWIA